MEDQEELPPPAVPGGPCGVEVGAADATYLEFVAQLDKDGVLIVSPDLLGETNEIRMAVLNIKNILQLEKNKAASTAR